MNNEKTTIEIPRSHALVLFDWLARLNNLDRIDGIDTDTAEVQVLFDIEAILESNLAETLHDDYTVLLTNAKNSIVESRN